ncbi:MAG: hypothetical protein GY715_14475 [Planctomycetes bacterium]|nr:hypothetical protein [Planctomycetota bacterium]
MTPTIGISVLIGVLIVGIGVVALVLQRREQRDAMAGGGSDGLARLGRTRDANGRVVKLVDPLPMYMLRRYDIIDAEALERIAEELEPGVRQRRPLLIVGVIAVIVVIVAIIFTFSREGGPGWRDLISAIANPAIFAAVVGGAVAPIIAARQKRIQKVRNVMLRHERCPHCGYGLTGVPRADDGATVCPECECAWRLDDVPGSPAGSAGRSAAQQTWMLMILAALGVLLAGGFTAYLFWR